jgi:AraC-like DNA-binding protein
MVMTLQNAAGKVVARGEAADPHAARVWRRLLELPATRNYRDAFVRATGLSLRFVDAAGLKGMARISGAYCGLLGRGQATPVACRRKARFMQEHTIGEGTVVCVCCVADVTEVVVPVFIGESHVANLLLGPFCLQKPTARDFGRLENLLHKREPEAKSRRLRELTADMRRLPVCTVEKYRAAAALAGLFAQYLAECGNRMLLEAAGERSPLLRKINRCFEERGVDRVPLDELARWVGLSRSHLCKRFKQETGFTLSEFRLQARIEKAKQLLLARHRRICEAAYEAGFGSIPHFNRVFRRFVGCAPSAYRERVRDDKRG